MNGAPWWRGSRGEWWVVAQGVLLVSLAAAPPLGPRLVPRAPWAAAAAFLLAAGGVVFLVAGARALGRSLSPLPVPRPGARLVRHGIYRKVRHPIYTGVILLAGGWAVYRGSALHLTLALAVAAFFGAKASREERWLARHYAEYDDYRRATRRFLPWLC
ncbi:MAG: isoprenylcysteine carboxylmethyltransferase family protein [Armatimonadota bacterium]|nr:isoprenylcysteine carboxylmethyltransferase family protein [Armatimonadota bacterium]MDR7559944.1 isoprenylcysteine carboxylmethyltransferase family protein [Armatimonadota bacterium]MDR7587700.1 isoprenylcysteine carboxylmethyltransferase family protein [Armatimonadota bacterium]MDR7611471.1 isoprenylcysteine carboxylmethyltransferase family protein [Armatimonadota bacterium]